MARVFSFKKDTMDAPLFERAQRLGVTLQQISERTRIPLPTVYRTAQGGRVFKPEQIVAVQEALDYYEKTSGERIWSAVRVRVPAAQGRYVERFAREIEALAHQVELGRIPPFGQTPDYRD